MEGFFRARFRADLLVCLRRRDIEGAYRPLSVASMRNPHTECYTENRANLPRASAAYTARRTKRVTPLSRRSTSHEGFAPATFSSTQYAEARTNSA